jgi:hypothetical protein
MKSALLGILTLFCLSAESANVILPVGRSINISGSVVICPGRDQMLDRIKDMDNQTVVQIAKSRGFGLCFVQEFNGFYSIYINGIEATRYYLQSSNIPQVAERVKKYVEVGACE